MAVSGSQSASQRLCRIEVTSPLSTRGEVLSSQLPSIGISGPVSIRVYDLYFLKGHFSPEAPNEIAQRLICDPVTARYDFKLSDSDAIGSSNTVDRDVHVIEVGFLPGVTDNVANELLRAIQRLGNGGVESVATGVRYELEGELTPSEVEQIAEAFLFNDVIQRYALGEIQPEFVIHEGELAPPTYIDLHGMNEAQLEAVNVERRLALDMEELKAIQAYFDSENRPATDGELETLAQTWSEHCVHKTFRAQIDCEYDPDFDRQQHPEHFPDMIFSILRTYLRAATEKIDAPWVRSAFVDNAGVIEFDDTYDISFKVETHNHPSAIEPFGGANTGIGGVVRDVLGVSHRPIASTDVLCFGPADTSRDDLQAGVLHPERIREGVVHGIEDYGNKLGLPTVNGAVLYHPGYTANPLVYCGSIGIGPRDCHPRNPNPGDRIIVIGGRTGRDGLRGATFSSQPMDAQTGKVAGSAVQIGDPITEKGVIEVVTCARDAGLYTAVTDCGAGGLSSAIGEMGSELGARVDLTKVRLKYAGLEPWEIWLSEAQERMVLAIPPDLVPELVSYCEKYWVEWQDVGEFVDSGRLQVYCGDEALIDLSNEFLHNGRPQRRLKAYFRANGSSLREDNAPILDGAADARQLLLGLLSHADIASNEDIIRRYDHLVRGATIVGPLVGEYGDGPSDAAVLKPLETEGWKGYVLANGVRPSLSDYDAYAMAVSAVDEAVRNAVVVGADPQRIALLDNFCWGNPRNPEQLAGLIRASQGCHDAALQFGTPFISGKDSLNNEYVGKDGERHAIPGTLLISSIAIHPDVRKAVSMDLKAAGSQMYLIGEWQPALLGSYALKVADPGLFGDADALQQVPGLAEKTPQIYAAFYQAVQDGIVLAAHDLSEGGLAVAAAEMALAGRTGLKLDLSDLDSDPNLALFAETNGCLLVEVARKDAEAFENLFNDLPTRWIGLVIKDPDFVVEKDGSQIISLPIEELVEAYTKQSSHVAS
jgi:phosphoribosylformylglycinamidine synthase II